MAHSTSLDIILLRGAVADTVLRDAFFMTEWQRLHDGTPRATAFQGPRFAATWYVAYRAQWEPVLVQGRDASGALVGLWPLAWRESVRALVHAGAHQAEYQGWLSLPASENVFISAAWARLTAALPVTELRCKYLPAPGQAETLRQVLGNVEARSHGRPLMRLVADDIRVSFAKKSNKSRFNRLKRLGELEFRRISDEAQLARMFTRMIEFYDLRQGAMNAVSPFHEDTQKEAFHRALFAAAPAELIVTATFLAGDLIAAYWGMMSGTQTHLGMLAHTPLLAEHSPGKLHIMQLSEHLLGEGLTVLDLTPGGDPWKERFANDHDEVVEATVYASAALHQRALRGGRLVDHAKQALAVVGVSPERARSMVAHARRVTPLAVVRKATHWVDEQREFRIYRCERSLAQHQVLDPRVRRDNIADLLLFKPSERWQSRQGFLSAALSRLEQGHTSWTIRLDGQLAHSGWMATQTESKMSEVEQTLVFPLGSVVLYDFSSAPGFRGRGLYRTTISHMLSVAFQDPDLRYAYISVLADNGPSRHVIEKIGFSYQGSFHWRRSLGRVSKWADAFPMEPAHA